VTASSPARSSFRISLRAEELRAVPGAVPNSLLKEKVLFGSDYPILDARRWLADVEKVQGRGPPADPERERVRLFGLKQ
jgi:hypothetical protein